MKRAYAQHHPVVLARLIALAIIIAAGVYAYWVASRPATDGAAAAQKAFRDHLSDLHLTVGGTVTRLLADDTEGTPHQRFIIRTRLGQTLLIAHNLDLAPRVPVQTGDRINVNGIYEWNEHGGLVHQTHHNPSLRSARGGGWIKLERTGKTYR